MAPKRTNRKIKRKLVKLAAITTSTYPPSILLHLPTELLVKILAYLPVKDLFSVRWTCRALSDIIAGTVYLQYIIRAHINGVEDSLPPDLPYSERLELLRRHEQSWSAPQFNLFTKCVTKKSFPEDFILQDGYLIYESILEDPPQYRYTDLYSAARNEELRWIHITIDNSRVPPLYGVTFAIDHNLVVGLSHERLGDGGGFHIQLAILEFTTGSLHPLSSTHIVSLPQVHGNRDSVVRAEVLGEHILVLLWNDSKDIAFYLLVSWKAGTVTLVNGLGMSHPFSGSRQNSEALRDPHTTTPEPEAFKPLVADDHVFVLTKYDGNHLEVCKLEITSPGPSLQTICSLELPPLMSGVEVYSTGTFVEWVPTSKNYARSRSSRASHSHFYSSTFGTIALLLDYFKPSDPSLGSSNYVLIIGIEALLYIIRTGVRNVPWADWGPSSTHLFERTLLFPAGPSWITGRSPLVLRQYYPRRTRYAPSIPEDTSSSSHTEPQVCPSTEVFGKLLDEHNVETNLPYRDVVVNNLNLDLAEVILADREWIVGMARTSVR